VPEEMVLVGARGVVGGEVAGEEQEAGVVGEVGGYFIGGVRSGCGVGCCGR
jgi:hypothetical protein